MNPGRPPRLESRARRWLAAVTTVERLLTVAAFVVLIGAVFLDVLSREFTGRGLYWALQAGVYANLVVVMVGIGLASQEGSHLRPRFADRWLPARWDPWLERVGEGLTALFCVAMAAVALEVVVETRSLAERSPVLGNLVWPVQAVIPLVFAVAALRHGLFAWLPALRPVPAAAEGAPE